LHYCNYCNSANVEEGHAIGYDYNHEKLAQNLTEFRRRLWRELVVSTIRGSSDFEMSSIQFVTLFLLVSEGELTIKRVAEFLGRSESATSRMLDQLVVRGLVCRREDERDRRVKRVSLSESGLSFVHTLEQKRVEAQMVVMTYLAPEERAVVAQAMQFLADAARRHALEHAEDVPGE
jgi:DNA-binding MarR family transcriptional regulator